MDCDYCAGQHRDGVPVAALRLQIVLPALVPRCMVRTSLCQCVGGPWLGRRGAAPLLDPVPAPRLQHLYRRPWVEVDPEASPSCKVAPHPVARVDVSVPFPVCVSTQIHMCCVRTSIAPLALTPPSHARKSSGWAWKHQRENTEMRVPGKSSTPLQARRSFEDGQAMPLVCAGCTQAKKDLSARACHHSQAHMYTHAHRDNDTR